LVFVRRFLYTNTGHRRELDEDGFLMQSQVLASRSGQSVASWHA
jgi:hypothetical protein